MQGASRKHLTSGLPELCFARVLRDERRREDAVGHDQVVVVHCSVGGEKIPASWFGGNCTGDLGAQTQGGRQLEARDVALEVGLHLLAAGPLGLVLRHRVV